MAGSMKLACLVLACMIVAGSITANALTCGNVFTSVTPCVRYLRIGGSIPAACCAGLRSLNNAARTTPDRQTACKCLKQAANSFGNVSRAIGLPSACGLAIPYKISPSTDCSKVL